MADEQVVTETPAEAPAVEQSETDWKAEAEKWKALARKNEERAKANAAADAAAKRLQQELEQVETAKSADLTALQQKVEELAAEREAEARARREAEVRAAAAGKLADPSDALRLLDVGSFDSADEIAAAVDRLVAEKPYLAGGSPRRFEGAADAGPRDGDPVGGQRQLNQDDLRSMNPDQIAEAFAAGRLKNLGFG